MFAGLLLYYVSIPKIGVEVIEKQLISWNPANLTEPHRYRVCLRTVKTDLCDVRIYNYKDAELLRISFWGIYERVYIETYGNWIKIVCKEGTIIVRF
jgi:hypothetical protein